MILFRCDVRCCENCRALLLGLCRRLREVKATYLRLYISRCQRKRLQPDQVSYGGIYLAPTKPSW